MNIRKLAFKLFRNKQYSNLKENKDILDTYIKAPKDINTIRLKDFLSFAVSSCKYYRDMGHKSISEYPILTKEVLKKNFEEIATVKKSDLKNYRRVTTSGSTGTPFQFNITADKQDSKQSQVLFFGSYSHFDIGTKHAFIRSKKSSWLKDRLMKNQYILSPDKLNLDWILNSIKIIKRKNIKILVGYPSVINNIAIVVNERKINISGVEGVITSGENLTNDMKKNIKDAFGIIPYSRYATEELGIIANEYEDGSSFLVNQVDFYIEVLDQQLKPVQVGESGMVVVTDFKSNLIPLVRYDTGDIARVKSYKDGLIFEIDQLEGRKIDTIFNIYGEPVSAFSINTVMRQFHDILQFQFIQNDEATYELKIQPLNLNEHADYVEAITSIEKLLGAQGRVRLNIVEEIHGMKSGKRPYIVNQSKRSKKNE